MAANGTINTVAKGKQKARRIYNRHGLHTLKKVVMVQGTNALDGRSAPVKALMQWRAELIRDLGGESALSAQRLALVEMIIRTRLYLDHCDGFLLQQPSLINKKRRSLLPIVRERMSLADSLARLLGQLGLDRIAKPMPSLAEYVATKETE
jgi:hypothetical protein